MNQSSKSKAFIVYAHIAPNGKRYIGITSQSPAKRWGRGNGYKGNPLFYNAICKYGWDSFEHLIIESNLSLDEACKAEMRYIQEYKTNDSRYGYNITGGGEYNRPSDEACKRLSDERIGISHPERRFALDDNWKYEIQISQASEVEYSIGEIQDTERRHEVYCDGIVYKSVKQFANAFGLEQSMVSNWLLGKYPIPQYFVDREIRYNNESVKYVERYNKTKRKVQIDGIIFNSVSECANCIGVTRHTISRWITGKLEMPEDMVHRGLKYIDEPNYYITKS